MSIRQHDFTIERHFRQAPTQTFQAFSDPALKSRWFGAPGSWTEKDWSLDFRVGGGELSTTCSAAATTTSSSPSGSSSPTTCCSITGLSPCR
jgi:uncharacterized protein YndB with AHSA1/START domain